MLKNKTFLLNQLSSILKDGRDSATLILIKNSHFNRTALYAIHGFTALAITVVSIALYGALITAFSAETMEASPLSVYIKDTRRFFLFCWLNSTAPDTKTISLGDIYSQA